MQIAVQEIKRGSYAEAFSSGIEFSIGIIKNKEINPLFGFTTCKDFLTDVIWSEKTKQPFSLYRFNWEPKNILRKNIYILIRNKNTKITDDNGKMLEKVLNFWEDHLEFKKSKVSVCDEIIIVKMSKDWFEKPYMMALFTTLCSCYPIRRDFTDFEDFLKVAKDDAIRSRYFYDFESVIKKIWNKVEIKFVDYTTNLTPHNVHYKLGLSDVNK